MVDNIVSPLQYIPFLETLQSKFNSVGAIKWINDSWHIPVAAICIYLVLIYVGRKWMANREPYNLKRPLFLWNVFLAVFSILGTINVLLLLLRLSSSMVYHTQLVNQRSFSILMFAFGAFFVLSKIVEFGDIVFIVLRKR